MGGKPLQMQLDTGSSTTIIPRNFGEELGKPSLAKTVIRLKQFDGSTIETKGQYQALLEMDDRFAVTDAECQKQHGLLGTDVLQLTPEALIIQVVQADNTEELECLKDFEARILLKDNAVPSYFEARALPLHIRPLVVAKLETMIKQGILERVPPGGSRWASPLVVGRKQNGDIRICADYKVGVNKKISSDSFLMPTLESAYCPL